MCAHPQRAQIVADIVAGVPYTRVAQKYGVPRQGLWRHVQKHERRAIQGAMDKRGDSVLKRISGLQDRVDKALRAIESGDEQTPAMVRQYSSLVSEARRSLETLGKITGEIETKTLTALYHKLGVKDEAELLQWADDRRRLTAMSIPELVEDCVKGLLFSFEQNPELREDALRRLAPPVLPQHEPSSAEVMEVEDGHSG